MAMRDFILNNFWLKVFSLVLATLIWYVINSNLEADSKASPSIFSSALDNTRDFRRPVTVITSAANRRLFSIHPTEVRIKVRGDRATLEKLTPEDIQVYVKLMDVPDSPGSVVLDVEVPRSVVLYQVSPSHVYVTSMSSINSTNNSTNN
jgi:YbbR domain-containing protein